MVAERKYVMTRISAGDYLLPSNDARTIWRIEVYEDGPSHGLDWPKDRALWRVRRWTGELGPRVYVDLHDWDRWVVYAEGFERRVDAVAAALEAHHGS
jgi:hypothetical protein